LGLAPPLAGGAGCEHEASAMASNAGKMDAVSFRFIASPVLM